jgi:hypothetical protein
MDMLYKRRFVMTVLMLFVNLKVRSGIRRQKESSILGSEDERRQRAYKDRV